MSELAQKIATIAAQSELKVLVIDVERIKGHFRWPAEDRFDTLTIEGDFWSLSDYKHKFGRVPYQHVTDWPRTICAAWRWLGDKHIRFAAEWEAGGPAAFAETIRDAMDQADIVTGHYVNGADRKWLNSLFRDHGLRFPSPYKVVDTLAVARRELGDESMTLGALCTRWGIPTKQGSYNPVVARAAVEGDRKAQRELKLYNCADVEASTGLYVVQLPLTKGHPHVAPGLAASSDHPLCPRCGSSKTERNGTWTPGVYVYARYLCQSCSGWFRDMYESRGPSVRAI